MDSTEARDLLGKQIDHLRRLSYAELRARVEQSETNEISGPSGTTYQLQVQVFWDGRKDENLRVIANIDDGGWRAFAPLGESFIMTPDGSFVGE